MISLAIVVLLAAPRLREYFLVEFQLSSGDPFSGSPSGTPRTKESFTTCEVASRCHVPICRRNIADKRAGAALYPASMCAPVTFSPDAGGSRTSRCSNLSCWRHWLSESHSRFRQEQPLDRSLARSAILLQSAAPASVACRRLRQQRMGNAHRPAIGRMRQLQRDGMHSFQLVGDHFDDAPVARQFLHFNFATLPEACRISSRSNADTFITKHCRFYRVGHAWLRSKVPAFTNLYRNRPQDRHRVWCLCWNRQTDAQPGGTTQIPASLRESGHYCRWKQKSIVDPQDENAQGIRHARAENLFSRNVASCAVWRPRNHPAKGSLALLRHLLST